AALRRGAARAQEMGGEVRRAREGPRGPRLGALPLQGEEGVAVVLVRTLPAADLPPLEMAPLREKAVAGDVGVDERQAEPHRPLEPKDLLEYPLAAVYIYLARHRLRDLERLGNRPGHPDAVPL